MEKKFRIWDDDDLKFCYGNFNNLEELRLLIDSCESYFYSGYLKDNPTFIQWYLGATDKNGKEVYEGDKLKVLFGNDDVDVVTITLDSNFQIVLDNTHKVSDLNIIEFEVVGNIHEI